MCLIRKPELLMRENKRVCYKVVREECGTDKLKSIHIRNYIWTAGVKKSGRRKKAGLTAREMVDGTVHVGIHVYWNERDALAMIRRNGCWSRDALRLLPVVCYKRYFVSRGDRNDAVFSQVTVRKADYKKAFEEANI